MRLKRGLLKCLSIILCIIIAIPITVYSEEFYKLSPKGVMPNFYYPYGIEVDLSGNIYIVDSGNHSIKKIDSDGNELLTWGDFGTTDGCFSFPKGIAMDSVGYIYVVDSGNNRIQKFSSEGNWIRTWGSYGSDNGLFSNPTDIAVDAEGYVYVTDTDNRRVQKFSETGEWIASYTNNENDGVSFSRLSGITVDDSGNIYVSENESYSVYKINTDENIETFWKGNNPRCSDYQIGVWWSAGNLYIADSYAQNVISIWSENKDEIHIKVENSAKTRLMMPFGIAVDTYGKIYITDSGSHNVEIFSPEGELISSIGMCGMEQGWYSSPKGIAVDKKGDIYIADSNNHRIQKIKPDGTFVGVYGENLVTNNYSPNLNDVAVDKDGNVYILDSKYSRVLKFSQTGEFLLSWGGRVGEEAQFKLPKGIAVDALGNVYVTDSVDNCIQKFNSNGVLLAKWGSSGNNNGQFLGVAGIAVDKDGFIYVTENDNCRIQKLNPDGTWSATIGTKGGYDNQFVYPEGIAVDNNGYIYVCDTANDRIQIFKQNGEWIETIGYSGSENSLFHRPVGIAIGNRKQIYVADTGNNRIQVLNQPLLLGDFDKNGDYNSNDYTRMSDYVMEKGFRQTLEYDLYAADINGDGVVNTIDLAYIRIDSISGERFPVLSEVDLSEPKYKVEVSVQSVEGTPGNIIAIPIRIADIPKEGISNFGFSIMYDTDIFCLADDGTANITGDFHVINVGNTGRINYMYVAPNNPFNREIVTYINLKIKDSVLPGVYGIGIDSLGIGCYDGENIYSVEPEFDIGEIVVKSVSEDPTKAPKDTPTVTPTETNTVTPSKTPKPSTETIITKPVNQSKPNNNSSSSSNSKTSNKDENSISTPTPTTMTTSTPTSSTPTPSLLENIEPHVIVEPDKTEMPAAGYKFIDINGHWAEKNIMKLAEKNLISGYSDGSMRPDQFVSRNEAAVIIVKMMNLEPYERDLHFIDNESISSWAKPYIGVAFSYGFIKGYDDNSFRGNEYLTRAQACAIIMECLSTVNRNESIESDVLSDIGIFKDLDDRHWAKDILRISIDKGIINGYPDGTLRPDNNVTRAEFCTMASILLKE
jgi:tripartite motif-containing protein 71